MTEPRVHRARLGRVVTISALLPVVLGGSLMCQAMSREDASPVVALWVVLGVLVFFGALAALVLRPRTVVADDGVAVRRVFGTRRYTWAEIRDVATDHVHVPGRGPAVLCVVLVTADGTVRLPNVNEQQLGDVRDVERELEALRELWRRGGGGA